MISGKGIETLIGATNAVNFERVMFCQKYKEECKDCEFYNFTRVGIKEYGKRCELVSTYNTLCKVIEKACPKPILKKFESDRD